MITKKSHQLPFKYECIRCNYNTSNKKDYNKHLITAKHLMVINDNNKSPEKKQYECRLCNKIFKYSSGLSRHAKICKDDSNAFECIEIKNQNIDNFNTVLITKLLSQNQELLVSNQQFKELMIEQSKQIQEQQNENQKLQTKLIEVVKDNCGTVNNTTNNNNQKFNLNFFLNTTCKDAMNMSEFIENMEIGFKDIENIGRNGYVSGMTDMILSRIKELDVTKRPLHCTDLKRETMYIKDNNEWSKDTPDNSKLHKTIKYVAKRNYATIPLWRENYPECQDWNHPKYDFCVDMMRNILGDIGDEQTRLDNKVIRNLSKHITVEKS